MAVSKRFAADHCGPLALAPQFAGQDLTGDLLDQAVIAAIHLQRDCWFTFATDGEIRRLAGPADPVAELQFLAAHTPWMTKIRIPREAGGAIASRATLEAVIAGGVSYIQLDASPYAQLMHNAGRAALAAEGGNPDELIERLLDSDNSLIAGLDTAHGVTIAAALHDVLDRRAAPFADDLNQAAAWKILHGLKLDRFLVDVGSDPDVDFGFLSLFPEQVQIVLGLIDTRASLPGPDDLVERIDRAAQVVDTDRFALSPRHGFALEPGEDPATLWSRQRQVLDLVLEAYSRAWGIDF